MLQLPQLTWKRLTVCSLYLPPNSPVSKLSLVELFEQLPKPFLVLGDFNAHSPAWGDFRRDGRRRMLEEFMAENDLIILNSGEQTFVHSAYHLTSAIDLAVASPSIAAECS
ncbi:RNA-directed DNA polymerase from mobile element jockey [Plakobranchus ocellatus]|uniref:RNA-directed DNA polymerase from mobile element jockey n=1 Tax=Plakobranchus ocellatus TaxID=259542 RepID=A0AAV3YQI4_9GAST|nr:RNA-directed DNA polymerase from mobile element jockey [Plakobranchus ocellatus]